MCAVANAQVLHESLTKAVFAKLEKKQDVGLALLILFQLGDASKPCKDDKRNISVFFDTDAYDTYDMYAASREFYCISEYSISSGGENRDEQYNQGWLIDHSDKSMCRPILQCQRLSLPRGLSRHCIPDVRRAPCPEQIS